MTKAAIKDLQEKIAGNRDQQAYKTLFLYFHPGLIHFALPVVRRAEAAEEVVSDVMMNLWQMREGLSAVDNLSVYLYRSVKNRALNYVARNQKHQFIEISSVENSLCSREPDPGVKLEGAGLSRHLSIAVNALPPKCRMVYQLVKEQGLLYREVAGILGISENTVDRHLNNALHKLIKALRPYLDDHGEIKKKYDGAMGKKPKSRVLNNQGLAA